MTHLAYLAGLMLAIAGLLVLDRRYALAFWFDKRRTWRTILPAVAIFIVWDFAGIIAGIFYHGASRFSLPFTLLPEFPVEELFFLFLLCYVSLMLYRGVRRVWPRT